MDSNIALLCAAAVFIWRVYIVVFIMLFFVCSFVASACFDSIILWIDLGYNTSRMPFLVRDQQHQALKDDIHIHTCLKCSYCADTNKTDFMSWR